MIVSNGWMNFWAFDEHGRKSQYNAHQSIEIRLQKSTSERVKVHVCTDKLGRQNKFCSMRHYRNCTIAGSIVTNDMTLRSGSQFTGSSTRFTLEARTSGGPPTTSTWTRDGVEITSGISISLEVDTDPQAVVTTGNIDAYLNSRYINTLVVTGVFPGVYQYSASNRAMASPRTDSFAIEGTYYALS